MKKIKYLSILFFALLFLSSKKGFSQNAGDNDSQKLKIGIALSGGGAKGFAHIGVLKVLEEENIPVHIVTGTSMGAIIGGLYAMGYTPGQLEEIALNTDWQRLFNDNLRPSSKDLSTLIASRDSYLLSFPIVDKRPQLPTGLIDGQNISMLLYRLTLPYHNVEDFTKLPVEFGAIATDLATGKAKRFESGYLPDAIRASMAIPSIFKPVKIDNKTYIDGGISRDIPAEDARDMGANIVLISDVSEPVKPVDSLDTFVNILFQAIGFHQIESDSTQIKLADFYIRPDIDAYNSFSYGEIEQLIKKGEEATRAIIPQLKARLDSLNIAAPPQRPQISPDVDEPLNITGVNYQNIDHWLARQTEISLDINPPTELSFQDIEQKINGLYETGFFSQISYRLHNDPAIPDGRILSLDFNYNEPDRVGFGMRYDSPYKASLLFGAELRNKLIYGDQFSAALRLGEILGISTHYNFPIALKPASKFQADFNVHRSPIDIYAGGDRLATVKVEQLEFSPSISIRPFKRWELQTGLHTEFYNLNEAVGNIFLLEKNRFLLNGFASLEYNSLNRTDFPTRGQRLLLMTQISDKRILSDYTYSQMIASWKASIPVFKGVQFLGQISAGFSSTDNLPLHYRFYFGGLTSNPIFTYRQVPLWGYSVQQLSASNMAAARAGLQFHLGDDVYMQAGWNAVHLSDSRNWNLDDLNLHHGYGISLGAITLIGPVSLSLSTPDFKKHYAFKIDVGYNF